MGESGCWQRCMNGSEDTNCPVPQDTCKKPVECGACQFVAQTVKDECGCDKYDCRMFYDYNRIISCLKIKADGFQKPLKNVNQLHVISRMCEKSMNLLMCAKHPAIIVNVMNAGTNTRT